MLGGMKLRRAVAVTATLLLFSITMGASAQQAYPTRDLLETGKTVMGEQLRYPTGGPAKVTVSIVTVAPGPTPLCTIIRRRLSPTSSRVS